MKTVKNDFYLTVEGMPLGTSFTSVEAVKTAYQKLVSNPDLSSIKDSLGISQVVVSAFDKEDI